MTPTVYKLRYSVGRLAILINGKRYEYDVSPYIVRRFEVLLGYNKGRALALLKGQEVGMECQEIVRLKEEIKELEERDICQLNTLDIYLKEISSLKGKLEHSKLRYPGDPISRVEKSVSYLEGLLATKENRLGNQKQTIEALSEKIDRLLLNKGVNEIKTKADGVKFVAGLNYEEALRIARKLPWKKLVNVASAFNSQVYNR